MKCKYTLSSKIYQFIKTLDSKHKMKVNKMGEEKQDIKKEPH